ncbi:hypothetical protein [Streptomyces sp. GQFP]|uniref:hypothetical protein n=1 Tax=Streptomyces sp. GQFP TaxID=2907545 RepID=UPI001F2E6F73|nr:hypothetical protein [Streptomyces sp. GQFP]UIX31078.1 hypothetical protein LUX31_14125 [Streptomyces sp. GQFP]
MPKSLPHGVFRTVRWWTAAGTSLVVLFISLGWSLLTSLEFDEQCNQGVVDGPGRLLDIRRQTFPPAVICEYEQGDVSAGATGVLGAVVWLSVVCLTVSVLLGLLVEWTDPPTPGTTDRLVPRAPRSPGSPRSGSCVARERPSSSPRPCSSWSMDWRHGR